MPTLLQINSAKNCGSTGKIAEQIATIAQRKGWDVFIAHGYRYNHGGTTKGVIITRKYGELFHYIKSLLSDGQGLGSVGETRRFILWIESINPDIVHIHNLHGYYINYKVLFEYLITKKIPVVWTFHDCWPFTGHCVFFDRVNCVKWLSLCNHCPQTTNYPKSLFDLSTRNYELKQSLFTSIHNMTIVPVSNWLSNLVKKSFLSKYQIHTIHNGVDIDLFKPCESDFRKRYALDNVFIVLGVADGYGKRKGLPDFNVLSARFGDDIKVVMVGLSESDKKQIAPGIIGMGRTGSQQELVEIYSSADVYINPTCEDNFPTTNLEALACGTPVITYATGGSPEAIDENTGIVVNKGDVDGLFNAIETIKIRGKSSYSKACRERAMRCFNKEDRFKDYLQLYDDILAKSK